MGIPNKAFLKTMDQTTRPKIIIEDKKNKKHVERKYAYNKKKKGIQGF